MLSDVSNELSMKLCPPYELLAQHGNSPSKSLGSSSLRDFGPFLGFFVCPFNRRESDPFCSMILSLLTSNDWRFAFLTWLCKWRGLEGPFDSFSTEQTSYPRTSGEQEKDNLVGSCDSKHFIISSMSSIIGHKLSDSNWQGTFLPSPVWAATSHHERTDSKHWKLYSLNFKLHIVKETGEERESESPRFN